jgi:deazaflavin-dependent oxidoreductase (nitroreductase family)
VYQQVGDAYAVFASKGGAPTNPDWHHNLLATPDTKIEIGTETLDVTARVADDDERSRIWETQKERYPNFAEYERTAGDRVIPVVVLEPRS